MSRTAVVGGGILGLTLAHRLASRGVAVDLYEAAPELGGLAGSFDYGEFVWDRFYHCILPTDRHLIGLLGELGLADALRWTRTGTGYFAGGRTYDMNGNRDFLQFPLLGPWQKARLAWCTLYARHFADPERLRSISAADWLTRMCGRRAYQVFWEPLLRAKFGPYHDRVAASFLWATIRRLFGARSNAAQAERLGYCSGGYHRILRRFEAELLRLGVRARTSAAVRSIELAGPSGALQHCRVAIESNGRLEEPREYGQVLFTGPTRAARSAAGASLLPYLDRFERDYPSASTYLGVICCNVVLDRQLTPYYVSNLADEDVELTGVVEMTNLIDRATETHGRSLVYLPRYLPSDSPQFDQSDDELRASFLERGLFRVFPRLERSSIRSAAIQRARLVQPLPLVRPRWTPERRPEWERPFALLNTSMLECSTLNNDEVVALVDAFVARHALEIAALVRAPAA